MNERPGKAERVITGAINLLTVHPGEGNCPVAGQPQYLRVNLENPLHVQPFGTLDTYLVTTSREECEAIMAPLIRQKLLCGSCGAPLSISPVAVSQENVIFFKQLI
ncbi:hypothetical protein HY357_02635 [Candidatus Roizmanbacteria bacterium]|nr:hypothetical protein [Candidatus Roizmanbacteria bacterium]